MSLKRCFDVCCAAAGLLASAPLLGGLALLIRLDSPGPVLFRQTRIGLLGRPFELVKLRTMRAAASPGAQESVLAEKTAGAQITAGDDPRITSIGRWLRRSKLDELPELWNVLRGDMSLVGPRPEVPCYRDAYPCEIFSVRPGLTGQAALCFHAEESLLASAHDKERAYREVVLPHKLALALDYVRNPSFGRDLRILAATAYQLSLGRILARAESPPVRAARAGIAQLNRQESQEPSPPG